MYVIIMRKVITKPICFSRMDDAMFVYVSKFNILRSEWIIFGYRCAQCRCQYTYGRQVDPAKFRGFRSARSIIFGSRLLLIILNTNDTTVTTYGIASQLQTVAWNSCAQHYLQLTRCHAIAKITARCAQYISALKIVCKHKSSRRLRKNLHITILSLFGGVKLFSKYSNKCDHGT